MDEERERQGFWKRLFSSSRSSAREERVLEYIVHRLDQGASLVDVVEEEYVRRNASRAEVEEITSNPKVVEAARKEMQETFRSGELDPERRPE